MDASSRWIPILAALAVSCLAVAHGCGPTQAPNGPQDSDEPPAVRLVLLSNVAGALEPCGCTKDQLGGLDHLGALLAAQRPAASNQLLFSVGSLLFDAPRLDPERTTQGRWKAETIAAAMKDLGLRAWAPGAADYAAGVAALAEINAPMDAQVLALNLDYPAPPGTAVIDVGATKVGVIGLSTLSTPNGELPAQLPKPKDAAPAELARQAVAALEQQGAQLLVGLFALPRAEALELVAAVPALNVLAVGDPTGQGMANDSQPSPMLVGSTLVVQTANHVQTVAIVDIHLRAVPSAGWIPLSDAGGLARDEELRSLARRIAELGTRIADWEVAGKVDPKDLAARRVDLANLRDQHAALEQAPLPSVKGSTFRYSVHDISEAAGSHPLIAKELQALNQRVNEHNRTAFADRKPPPAVAGAASYVGVDGCSSCHASARKHWDSRPHARAYTTLQRISREYDLDCVGCHVTGYEKPGGSTVTFNAKLQGVQCETCHGPGSLHVADPTSGSHIVLRQEPRFCTDRCHHSPHVEGFDPVAKMPLILGPGHGG